MGHFGLKMTCHHNSRSTLRIFFGILHNERGLYVHKNFINGFSEEKNILLAHGTFWAQKWCDNSGAEFKLLFQIFLAKLNVKLMLTIEENFSEIFLLKKILY